MEIGFYGGAGEVTGSCFLIVTDGCNILLDCGLFQGSHEVDQRNFMPFPFSPSDIDYLLLSHAHIDHSGRIPRLYSQGFKGKIICTKATADLCEIMLLDSAHIQQMEAEWHSRKRKRAGLSPVEPLYTQKDAARCTALFEPVPYREKLNLSPAVSVRFLDAGHILGSSIVELWIKEGNTKTKLVYTGDLGNRGQAIIRDPDPVDHADILIMESTYGNRSHENLGTRLEKLADVIRHTFSNGGNLIIPAFAIERTQEIIYWLNHLVESGTLPRIPVYIDSPLAVSATDIFRRHPECFDPETLKLLGEGDDPFHFPGLKYVRTAEESKALNELNKSSVIIAASGMAEAGRIKHHLKHNLWRPESAVLFVGYQAEGTLGRRLLDGADRVKIFGEEISVRARIYSIGAFSAHADQKGLMDWVIEFETPPKQVFIVHGEAEASQQLKNILETSMKLEASIPSPGQRVTPTIFGGIPFAPRAEIERAEFLQRWQRLSVLEQEYLQLTRELAKGAEAEHRIAIESQISRLESAISEIRRLLQAAS